MVTGGDRHGVLRMEIHFGAVPFLFFVNLFRHGCDISLQPFCSCMIIMKFVLKDRGEEISKF